MVAKPIAWSYSSLDAFETCARRFYLTKIVKTVAEPQTEATMWGNRVHKALELRVGKGQPLPEGMEQYESIAATILSRGTGGKVEVEQKLALNKSFRPTTWFGKDVWVRGITDVTVTKGDSAFIGDYKTGAPKPASGQLRLTAAITFAHKPWVNNIKNAFIWLKTGETTKETFTRDDVPAIWQEFMPRVRRLEQAIEEEKFPPRPSGLCRQWCPCTGCEHNGRYTGRR